jgi:hypothetical protein
VKREPTNRIKLEKKKKKKKKKNKVVDVEGREQSIS